MASRLVLIEQRCQKLVNCSDYLLLHGPADLVRDRVSLVTLFVFVFSMFYDTFVCMYFVVTETCMHVVGGKIIVPPLFFLNKQAFDNELS